MPIQFITLLRPNTSDLHTTLARIPDMDILAWVNARLRLANREISAYHPSRASTAAFLNMT